MMRTMPAMIRYMVFVNRKRLVLAKFAGGGSTLMALSSPLRMVPIKPGQLSLRCVGEGLGGTLTFTSSPSQITDSADGGLMQNIQSIRRVGTFGLITCVGVYFSIDANRCFLAHINAYINRRQSLAFLTSIGPHVDRRIIYPGESDSFRRHTRDKLREHAKHNGWDPVVARSEILQSLIVACPRWKGFTGGGVIEGLKAFLNIEEVPVHEKEGFIVEHPNREPLCLEFEEARVLTGEPAAELEGYDVVPADVGEWWNLFADGLAA